MSHLSLESHLGKLNGHKSEELLVLCISGAAIEKLCEHNGKSHLEGQPVPRAVSDRAAMVRAARCLLAAVTRVLLLADSVVVKQLLLAKDKVRQHNVIQVAWAIVSSSSQP